MAAWFIPPSDELSRRIRAAAAYGDFKSVDAFAAEIGLGRSTLFRIFRGERGLKEMEARQMAAVAGLPLDWFEMDLSRAEKPPLPPSAPHAPESDEPPKPSLPLSSRRSSASPRSRREASG